MAEVDMDLLLSVVKGLGCFTIDNNKKKVYCKDDDCLRKPFLSLITDPADASGCAAQSCACFQRA